MNNLELILERIVSDSRAEALKITSDADLKTEDIKHRAEDRCSDIRRSAENAAMKEYGLIISRAQSSAAMEKREIILKAKTELIERVFRDAESFICALPDKKYNEVMARLLADAVSDRMNTVRSMTEVYSDSEFEGEADIPFEVLMNEKDKGSGARDIITLAEKIISDRVKSKPTILLSESSIDAPGGFIVRYGMSETNCTVEVMIRSLKERMYSKVAAELFQTENKA